MNLTKVIDKVVRDVSYKTSNGMVDLNDPYHVVLLKEEFSNYIDPGIVFKALYEVDDEKMIKYKDEDGESKEMKAGSAKTMPDEHPAKQAWDKMQDDDGDDSKPAQNIYEPEEPKKKSEPKTSDPKQKDKSEPTDTESEIESLSDFNLEDQSDITKKVQPVLTSLSKKITKLVEDGKKDEAKKIAETLVEKLQLQQALYLQYYPGTDIQWKDKEGKIYVGPKGKKLTGQTARSVGQSNIVKALESAGVKIPVKAKGISRTAMSIQHTTTDRSTGQVSSEKTKNGGLIKKIAIGERQITFVADPDSETYELDLLKLQNIEDGDIEFVDVGDTSTPEGRQKAIRKICLDVAKQFEQMKSYLPEDKKHSISVAEELIKEFTLDEDFDPQKDPEKFIEMLQDALAKTKVDGEGEINEFKDMTAYLAESVEAMVHLSNGRETLIPSSGNFKTADVIPLIDGDPKQVIVTEDGVEYETEVKSVSGTSVKYDGGAASSLFAKHANTIYGKLDRDITVKGQSVSNTKDAISGVLSYYKELFGEGKDQSSKVEMTDEYYNKSREDLLNTMFEYYPELKDTDFAKDIEARIDNAVNSQLKRLNKGKLDKGEGEKERVQRMKLYHLSQFAAGALSNHPEHGIKQQAYANADYAQGKKGGKPYVSRKAADGINSISWVGFAPDKGYNVSKDGHLSPTNTYSSDLKHINPMEKELKKYT